MVDSPTIPAAATPALDASGLWSSSNSVWSCPCPDIDILDPRLSPRLYPPRVECAVDGAVEQVEGEPRGVSSVMFPELMGEAEDLPESSDVEGGPSCASLKRDRALAMSESRSVQPRST